MHFKHSSQPYATSTLDRKNQASQNPLQNERNNESKTKPTGSNGDGGGFKISGRQWSSKDRKDDHQVFWNIREVGNTGSGLPDEVYLAAVVEHHGPFQGIVQVDAKSIAGSRFLNSPWSADDPLLFDGITQKGQSSVKVELDNILAEEEWLRYIYGSKSAWSSVSGEIDISTETPSITLESTKYARPATLNEFHIAVICALRIEQTAVEACFDEFWDMKYGYVKAPGDTNAYTFGRIGNHNVVLVHMSVMGNSSAASVAASLRSSFHRIEFALVVGICGGVPIPPESWKPEIWLGDVVISTSVVQYDFGRREPTGFRMNTLQSNLGRPDAKIRNLLVSIEDGRNYNSLRDRLWDQLPSLIQRQRQNTRNPARYPGLEEDRLFEASYPHRCYDGPSKCTQCMVGKAEACELSKDLSCVEASCDLTKLRKRDQSGRKKGRSSIIQGAVQGDMLEPEIHFGVIASGNQVMKSGVDRDAIAKEISAIAFEMEGAGVWDHFPSVVIKGVCDYSDSHKNYDWQGYAALTAAACMKAFLYEWSRQNPQVI